MPKVVAALYNF